MKNRNNALNATAESAKADRERRLTWEGQMTRDFSRGIAALALMLLTLVALTVLTTSI